MKTSLVILNWNGEKFLREYLPSVIQHCQNENTEIVVADNHSTDGSIDLLRSEFPTVRIIELDQNYGFAGGYNRALSQIDSEYYVLCNSDILLKSDAVSPIIEAMDNDKSVAVAAPKLKALLEPGMFEYAGAAGGFIDKYGYPFCRGRIMETVEKDEGQYNDECEIFWATGAFMVVRSSVWRELGGLDDTFFAHMEEIDMCWRVKNRGFRIMYYPQAEAFHLGGGTLNQGNPRKIFLNFRNSLWMLFKNLPKGKLISRLYIRMCMDGASAMIYLMKGQFSYFWAVLRAHWALYANVARLWRARNEYLHSSKTTKTTPTCMLDGSMVWRYMIKKLRTFNKLYTK